MNLHTLFWLALATVGPVFAHPFSPRATTPGLLPKRITNPKIVFAHHMVGNTYPYRLKDWEDDIRLAHAYGIDGFALNMGQDGWQPARIADA